MPTWIAITAMVNQTALLKLAFDGTTILDESYTFKHIKAKSITGKRGKVMRKINQARNYKESSENMGSKIPDVPQHQMRKEDRLAQAEARLLNDDGGAGASSIVEITQPGYYNLNHYLFCKDVKDAQQLFNNANIYGLVAGRKLNRMEMIMSGKTHEWFGWDLDYKGDKILADGFQIRRNINAIKANIAENFGTFGDLVIENLDSGKLARLTGENIFHKKEFTPKKDILRPTIAPQSAIRASNWMFRGSRGNKVETYIQEGHDAPMFVQAAQSFSFHPTRLQARKRIFFLRQAIMG